MGELRCGAGGASRSGTDPSKHIGIRQDGTDITLHFQLKSVSAQDLEDLDDIVWELESLVGQEVRVSREYEVLDVRSIIRRDGIRWIYLSRDD